MKIYWQKMPMLHIPHAGKDFAGVLVPPSLKYSKRAYLAKRKQKRQVDPLIIYLAALHGIDSREKISLMNYWKTVRVALMVSGRNYPANW